MSADPRTDVRLTPLMLGMGFGALVGGLGTWLVFRHAAGESGRPPPERAGGSADAEVERLREELRDAIRRAVKAETDLRALRQQIDESSAEAEEVARLTELSLLGPSRPWSAVPEPLQPTAIRQRIDEVERTCGGSVGLIELDCEEYPCIAWTVASSSACSLTGGCRAGSTNLIAASDRIKRREMAGISFMVYCDKSDDDDVSTRTDWRISRRKDEYSTYDPEVLRANHGALPAE
jgi:hypothetical protein